MHRRAVVDDLKFAPLNVGTLSNPSQLISLYKNKEVFDSEMREYNVPARCVHTSPVPAAVMFDSGDGDVVCSQIPYSNSPPSVPGHLCKCSIGFDSSEENCSDG